MPRRTVILGTDTSVGKTWLACGLARAAPPRSCLALKPIETGVSPTSADTDAALLRRAAGHGPSAALYQFAQAVTPWLAASDASGFIELSHVIRWVHATEGQPPTAPSPTLHYALCIVETAGGVFSPLSRHTTNFDLARALEPAHWILVAPDSLGVLHQVSATLLAMAHRGRWPDLVLLSAPATPDASTERNAPLLRELHPEVPFVVAGRNDQATLTRLYGELVR